MSAMGGDASANDRARPSCPQFRPEQLNLASATPLGAGAISQVVRSTLSGPTQLPIAVKIVSKLQALKCNKVASVMNERAALIRLAPHPFIARLYGTSQSEDELYFVMEWLPHGDLLQHIRRTAAARVRDFATSKTDGVQEQQRGSASTSDVTCAVRAATARSPDAAQPQDKESDTAKKEGECAAPATLRPIPASSSALRCLDFHDIQLITAQLVLGLARVVAKGFVLRDLKPENVAFDDKYRACLLDFDTIDLEADALLPESNDGVALPARPGTASTGRGADASAARRRRITVSEIQNMRRRTLSFCGTAQYVSPEMVGECKWSYSSDLWALGAVVYEMMYGVHMFSGLSCFDVLRKVIRGVDHDGHATVSSSSSSAAAGVSFPFVALGSTPDAFARVKDFIVQLMRIDPHRRLGVHPVTHAFDLAALQQHALFDGFDWPALEAHIRHFRPRDLAGHENSRASSPLTGATWQMGGVACEAANRDGAAIDDTPSLQPLYHQLPRNDASYADYVYHATADANPFERFMKMILLNEGDPSGGPQAAAADAAIDDDDVEKIDTPASDDEGDEEDDIEVVDDVGMRYTGNPAADDFQY